MRYANYVPELEERSLAGRIRLAVVRLNRRLRAQRTSSSVTLTQFSALSSLKKCGPMTPGAAGRVNDDCGEHALATLVIPNAAPTVSAT